MGFGEVEGSLKRRIWSVARVALGLALSVGLGWLAARGLDWSAVGASFRDLSLPMAALAVGVFMGASYLRAARWRMLFVEDEVSTNRLFVIQNVGIGLNNVTPIRVASEAAQVAILSLRDGVRPSVALATVGMERVLDLVVTTAIMAAAFFMIPEMRQFAPYVWVAVALVAVCVALVRLVAWSGSGAGWTRKLPSSLVSFGNAVRDLERERTRLAVSSAMSIAYWLLVGVTSWLLAEAIGLSISPVTATLVIMGTIFFATSIPAAPAAVGTFEFAVVYALGLFGVEREPAFGFAVIVHAALFLPPTIMAAVFLPREGIGSFDKLRSLMSEGATREKAGST